MILHRHALPQLADRLFVTDGGLETTLIHQHGIALRDFAAFELLGHARGISTLRAYYHTYARLAANYGMGLVLEAPTWRASRGWGERLGYDEPALDALNRQAVRLLCEVRQAFTTRGAQIVVSGNIGPRGDGYRAERRMSAAAARDYHSAQIATFAGTLADMVAAFTLNYADEAVGIVHAARDHGMPVAVSFTLETDGRLPSGETLENAIERTDAETDAYAAYYMINCAHPTHFAHVVERGGAPLERIRGIRANASRCSHAELDASDTLDDGDPRELGAQYRALRDSLPQLSVLGGCCGTDHRHVKAICRSLWSLMEAA
jgi:S-methylmethionine-dependent homocysteine/selenocysteine methylase